MTYSLISTKTDPEFLARMVRLGNRYSPRRFAIVESTPPSECDMCGTSVPLDGDVLVTGLELRNGKFVLLDEFHDEVGTYASLELALKSYAQAEDHDPAKLEVLWLDDPDNRFPPVAASG